MLTYLLFEAQDEDSYVAMVEEEIDDLLKDANRSSFYLTKKSVRKALRQTDKYIRYSDEKETEVRLRLYFLTKLKTSEIKIGRSKVLTNMYMSQIKKVKTALEKLHEDLQYDYQQQLERL
ncbi:MAG: hypothetical protein R2784_03800 [Saprospiraceae bacterium]